MNKDKHPRTYLGVLLMTAVLLACASLPASGQARNNANNSGQAVLHIRVNIVPALIAPPPPIEPKKPLIGAVAYNVPMLKSNVEVIEETRPLFVRDADGAERLEGAILKTLTIVPH